MKKTYLALLTGGYDIECIDESDSFKELKNVYENKSDVVIAKVIWVSKTNSKFDLYPVPEGECLDEILGIQEN